MPKLIVSRIRKAAKRQEEESDEDQECRTEQCGLNFNGRQASGSFLVIAGLASLLPGVALMVSGQMVFPSMGLLNPFFFLGVFVIIFSVLGVIGGCIWSQSIAMEIREAKEKKRREIERAEAEKEAKLRKMMRIRRKERLTKIRPITGFGGESRSVTRAERYSRQPSAPPHIRIHHCNSSPEFDTASESSKVTLPLSGRTSVMSVCPSFKDLDQLLNESSSNITANGSSYHRLLARRKTAPEITLTLWDELLQRKFASDYTKNKVKEDIDTTEGNMPNDLQV